MNRKQQTVNGYDITLEYGVNGVTASAMIKDSAGEYLHHKLYIDYDDETIFEVFAQDCSYLETF